MRLKTGFLCVALAYSFAIGTSYAQTPPTNVEAGTVGNFQINKERYERNKNKLVAPKNNLNISPLVDKQKTQTGAVKKLQFVLKDVDFEGNTIFTDEELKVYSYDLLGQEVAYEDILKLALKVTNAYKSKGYITSIAFLPPQEVVNGILKIKVLEGKLGNVEVKGNKWAKDKYFKNVVFRGNGLKQDEVFNVNNLKKSMIEINGQSYLNGKVFLDKGEAVGTTDIVLDVEDRVPLGLNASWGNQGRDLIGIQQAGIGITDYNITGYGDELGVNVTLADGTTGVGTNYSLPVGENGTRLIAGYSYSGVELGGIYKPAQIEGTSHFYKLGIQKPLFNNDRFNVIGDASFDFRDSDTTAINNNVLNNYQTRALRTGITAIENDFLGRWIGRVQTSFGLPIMGAQRTGTNSNADGQFFKLNGNLTRVHILPADFLAIARSSFQFSNSALYGSEQMQLGGAYTVRGFDEGVLLGDTGYSFSLEARHAVPYLKDVNVRYWKDKSFKLPLKDRIHAAAFYDFGMAKLNYQGQKTSFTNFLQGVGVGLRCNMTKYLIANLDVGVPLGKKRYAGQQDARLHFSISSKLF